MQAAAVAPPPPDLGSTEAREGGQCVVKRFRAMKRSFVDAAATAPRFEGDDDMLDHEANWFDDEIVLDPDVEGSDSTNDDGIPIVRLPKALRAELIEP